MIVKLIEHTPNPEKLIATAAKLCYSPVGIDEIGENLTEESVAKFLNMLMGSGHTSPIEHCSFTFAVEGCSRITEQQLTRHRIASYSIQSGRYVNRNNASFVIPPAIADNPKALKIYEEQIENNKEAYADMTQALVDSYIDEIVADDLELLKVINQVIDEKPKYRNYKYCIILSDERPEMYEKLEAKVIKRAVEDARYILPQSLETKIIFTMNLRTILNFISHRKCLRAQWEIRILAQLMLESLKDVLPTMINYIGAPCESGVCPEGKMSCGKHYKGED